MDAGRLVQIVPRKQLPVTEQIPSDPFTDTRQ